MSSRIDVSVVPTPSRTPRPRRPDRSRPAAPPVVEALEGRRLLAVTWDSLNPGAGGQVQDVVLDPLIEGRAFVLSDVEGLYRTTSGGTSWQYAGAGLAGTNTLALAVDPRNPSRVYVGTTVGLHASNNGGLVWSRNASVTRAANPTILSRTSAGDQQLAVGSVVVVPGDANGDGVSDRVVAGLGNRRDSDVARATVFTSTNGGSTFTPVGFGPTGGDRSILQLAYGANGVVYAAVEKGGIWKSTNFGQTAAGWTQVAAPSGATQAAQGVAVSPDGSKLYAVYESGTTTRVYGTPTSAVSWKSLDSGLPINGSRGYRTLATDPRASGASTDRLLVAEGEGGSGRNGLYETTVNWSGTNATSSWSRIFGYFPSYSATGGTPNRSEIPYDIGWEGGWAGAQPRPLAYRYAPVTWSRNEIWVSGDQTLLKVDRAVSNFKDKWDTIYTSDPVKTYPGTTINTGQFTVGGQTVKSYKTTGWASTVDFDADQYGQIVVSAKADHGIVMSWDGGATWEDMSSPSYGPGFASFGRSNAAIIVETSPGNVYVVAHLAVGNGANVGENQLWAYKVPDPNNPRPGPWVFLAGGSDGNNSRGLPNSPYNGFAQDKTDPKKLFVATRDAGTYVIPDLAYLYFARTSGAGLPFYQRIAGSPNSPDDRNNAVFVDPGNSRQLFVVASRDLWRGVWNGAAGTDPAQNWTWSKILTGDKPLGVDVWKNGSQTWIAATLKDSAGDRVVVSTNGGATFGGGFSLANLTSRRTPNFDFSGVTPEIFSVAGDGNRVYAVVQKNGPENLGHGVFQVDLNGSAVPTAYADVTGNLPLPKSFNFEVVRDAKTARKYLMLSSWGAGTWRFDLEGAPAGTPVGTPTPPPQSGQATFGNGGNPWAIPITGARRVQAENFDAGGEGVAFRELTATNLGGGTYRPDSPTVDLTGGTAPGVSVGWFDAGEWLEYTVNAHSDGLYRLRLHAARSGAGGGLRLRYDGNDVTGPQTFGDTGGWGTYVDRDFGINMTAGVHVIRIEKEGDNGLNVDWFELDRLGASALTPAATTPAVPARQARRVAALRGGLNVAPAVLARSPRVTLFSATRVAAGPLGDLLGDALGDDSDALPRIR